MSRSARSKARPATSRRSRRSQGCSLGSQPPGLEAAPDLDDSQAQVAGGSAELSSGLRKHIAQQADAGDGAGRVELELLVVELEGSASSSSAAASKRASYKSPGRSSVSRSDAACP